MQLESVPSFRLEESGVSFKYLVFQLRSGEAEKRLLRGVNFRPYERNSSERIERRLRGELESVGFDPQSNGLSVLGGGTVAVNPYYETVTVFGENPEHGSEPDRQATLAELREVFAGYEIHSYEAGEEEAPPKPKKKKPVARAKAKPAAAAPVAAGSSSDSEDQGEEDAGDDESE